MHGQQDRDVTVAKRAEGTRHKNPSDVWGRTSARMGSDACFGTGIGFSGAY
jgi:hypothetical protein